MAKITDIPYLVHLLDDESPSVREQVRQELMGLGQEEESVLMPFLTDPSFPQIKREALGNILEQLRLENYSHNSWNWLNEEDERIAQEEALSWLAYLSLDYREKSLSNMLDELAEKFLNTGMAVHVPNLFKFLFEIEGFGQPEDQFYLPQNSNLIQVLENKAGLQISLTMIVVFVARRLGLPLYGYNMPGHFLILHELENDFRVYDPFNKGEQIPRQTITYIQRMMVQRAKPLSIGKASTEQIVFRAFRNFMNSYQRQENHKMYDLFNEKFLEVKEAIREKKEF